MQLHDAITKAAQAGTEVSVKMGDVSVNYTKKTPTPRAAKPVAESAPEKYEAGSGGWHKTPTNAKQLSIVAKPSAVAAEPEGPKPLVGRNAQGQATSLKPGGTTKPATKKKAKAVPAATGPMVGRNARGQATSLKKN